jgi:hypothetical protein
VRQLWFHHLSNGDDDDCRWLAERLVDSCESAAYPFKLWLSGHFGPIFEVDERLFVLTHGGQSEPLICFDFREPYGDLIRVRHSVPPLPYDAWYGAGAECWGHLIVAGGCADEYDGPLSRRVIALPREAAARPPADSSAAEKSQTSSPADQSKHSAAADGGGEAERTVAVAVAVARFGATPFGPNAFAAERVQWLAHRLRRRR